MTLLVTESTEPQAADPTTRPTETAPRWPGFAAREVPWVDLALVATLAALAGLVFVRVLPVTDLLGRTLGIALVATAVTWLAGRSPTRSLATRTVITVAAYLASAGIAVYWSKTLSGLPTPSSALSIIPDLSDGVRQILSSSVPGPALAPSLLIPLTITWLAAFSSTELAVRTDEPLAPAGPPAVGFFVGLTFGGPSALLAITGLFIAATAALAALRSSRATARPTTPARRRAVLGAVVVVAAVTVASTLAGSAFSTQGEFDLHKHYDPNIQPQVAISPLDQIQAQLLQTPAVPLFQVTVPIGSAASMPNWRLTTLDRYDGADWSNDQEFLQAGRTLPDAPATAAPTETVSQQVRITNLGGAWLPNAAWAERSSLRLVDVGQDTNDLVLPTGAVSNTNYSLTSRIYQPGMADLLPGASVESGGGDATMPDGPTPSTDTIRHEADRITASATGFYAQLAALQTYLTGKTFRLSAQAPAGHSYARIADFLTTSHVGTSEQFATAFALMARAEGIPTRLAVGFRRGAQAGSTFTVTTADAYAWPEVDFTSIGWVPFDPTPAIDDSAAPLITPLPAQTASDQDAAGSVDVPAVASSGDELVAPTDRGITIALVGASALGILLMVLVGAAALVVSIKHRRLRRLRRAPTAAGRIIGAWQTSADFVAAASGHTIEPLTVTEVAWMGSEQYGLAAGSQLARIGAMANGALFADTNPTNDMAAAAWREADGFVVRVRRHQTRRARVAELLNPRPLWQRR